MPHQCGGSDGGDAVRKHADIAGLVKFMAFYDSVCIQNMLNKAQKLYVNYVYCMNFYN